MTASSTGVCSKKEDRMKHQKETDGESAALPEGQ